VVEPQKMTVTPFAIAKHVLLAIAVIIALLPEI
jgi:hypothetical protein